MCASVCVCTCVCVCMRDPLTLLTFISPGYASSHLSFIHSAICDQGSFSGTDVCQNRPCPMICSKLQPEQHALQQLMQFTEQELITLIPFPRIHQPRSLFQQPKQILLFKAPPFGLLSAVAGRKDKPTSLLLLFTPC